ncbi:MFS transporter [Gordonia humi]|uniref:DHA2 family multidrug resistance protein-like MFS transporter n=1 Tax=Gordonia humi TaxID=686429 RepID=A0A840EUA7_9ACTN|nr:MFS transporter [Gordonia humi]MBB4133948.1 DHA2 family multidrug resistance protein-like MFS transporter [Gordonia humi]
MTAATTVPNLSSRRAWAATAVLSASLLVVTMDMTILNIALPTMSRDLRPSGQQLLWIVDVYSLVLAGLLVAASSVADRWGRKRALLTGYLVFAVASLLVLVADSAGQVIAIRAALGIGGALIMPTTLSVIRTIFADARQRAKALAIWSAIAGLGAAVGPLVGGFLLEHLSWHAAFLVNVPLMVVAVIAGAFLLPESRSPSPGTWDWTTIVLSFGGMVALMWSIKKFGKESSLAVPSAWAVFVIAVLVLTVFVRRSLRQADPMLDIGLFRIRPFTGGITAALGSMFAMGAALLLLAQWLQSVDGSSAIATGLKLLPLAVASAVASLIAPRAAEAIGPRAVLAGSITSAGIGMIVLFVVPGDLGYGTVVASLVLVGAGIGSLAVGSVLIMSGSPEHRAGNAAAMEETSYEVGSVLGVAILGSIASVVYRAQLDSSSQVEALPSAVMDPARESIGAAVDVAEQAGLPQLADVAGHAFTESMQTTSLIGGGIMVAVAVIVWFVVPKGTTLEPAEH